MKAQVRFCWLIYSVSFSLVEITSILTSCNVTTFFIPGCIYYYNQTEINQQTIASQWYQKYYKQAVGNPYYQFLQNENILLSQPAGVTTVTNFDNLYDNQSYPKKLIWNNYLQLKTDLITTNLSEWVTIDLNWNQLFYQTRVNPVAILAADQLLVRMYNILALVYSKSLVLRLVQKINLLANYQILGYTHYSVNLNSIVINFGTNFLNQKILNSEHQINYAISNNLIMVIIHEYAHALCYYVQNSPIQRSAFNINPMIQFQTPIIKTKLSHNANITISPFNDVTAVLVNYLNQKTGIDPNNKIENFLLPLLVTNSNHSHISWIKNNVQKRDEFFAEAFVQWLTTTTLLRDYRWELLNNFFMTYFPEHYQLINS